MTSTAYLGKQNGGLCNFFGPLNIVFSVLLKMGPKKGPKNEEWCHSLWSSLTHYEMFSTYVSVFNWELFIVINISSMLDHGLQFFNN